MHQIFSHPSGTPSTSNGKKMNKKKRKRKYFQVNDNTTNASTTPPAPTGKLDDSNTLSKPAKRRRKNKKKRTDEGTTESIKPVLVMKNPEDYSANWKKLKEIITQDDKKPDPKNPAKYRTKDKFNANKKHKMSREKHQKTNKVENGEDKMENQDSSFKEEEDLDIWFDNVDPILLEENSCNRNMKKPGNTSNKKSNGSPLVTEQSSVGSTKVVAMDCEMVGVGMDGKDSILARVSIVNHCGKVLYDKFVKPTEEVVDYRTAISGIRPADLEDACEFPIVQKEVSDLIEGHTLVGHAIHNDLRILFLSHPRANIRDTSKYKGFKRLYGGRTPSLKNLTERLLGVQIQQGEHSSVQDAQAAMRLYTIHRREWEKSRPNKYKKRHIGNKDFASTKQKQKPQPAKDSDSG